MTQSVRRSPAAPAREPLTDDVDADRIGADLTDGVLTVRLPKAAPARARRIPVSIG